jgi:DNA-binding LytR/AlgR family response regulator
MSPGPRALIAEDEPLLAAALAAELAACWPGLALLPPAPDGAAALAATLAHRPDVCFLDIRMPRLDGLAAAHAIIEDWPHDVPPPLMVFVTAHDEYALRAFEAQALDYLLKPVEHNRLAACVARLMRQLGDRREPAAALDDAVAQLRAVPAPAGVGAPRLHVIRAQASEVVHLVPVEEVLYFAAADKYLRVVTAEREHLIRLSLRDLLPRLDPQRFWQVHRGLVVQARHILAARREETGRVLLTLRGRPETLVASRMFAHLFRGM